MWLFAAGAGVVVAAVLYGESLLPESGKRREIVRIQTYQVSPGEVEQTVRLTGATAAENFAALVAPQMRSGRRGGFASLTLQDVADPGARVRRGDVVAEFDRQDMLLRIDNTEAQVTQAEANLRKVQSELQVLREAHEHSIRIAKADLEKARLDLKTAPVRSDIDTQLLKLAVEEAEARYKQLLSEVKHMQTSLESQLRLSVLTRDEAVAELRRAQANADRMLVRAPIEGIIVMQTIVRGGEMDQVGKGDTLRTGQPFMQIVDQTSMVVNASANQVDAELIRIGARARVGFDAYPDLVLPAVVHGVGAMTKSVGWRGEYVKEIPVALRLLEMDPRVIPDLSVSVDVILAAENDSLVAPLQTIFQDTPEQRPFVFLQRPSGWERREVELGSANHIAVAVRSGLEEGDVIAAEQPPQTGRN